MGDLDPASSSVVELYLPKGLLAGESYAQTPDHVRLFGFYNPDQSLLRGRQRERVMLDAHSVPLFHSKYVKGLGLNKRVDVYSGEYDGGGSLVFSVMRKPSLRFKGLNFFSAGTPFEGTPDYELEVPTFAWESYKIFRHDVLLAEVFYKYHVLYVPYKIFNTETKREGHLHIHYKITFSSSMDQAMVVMFVAIFDDLRPKD